MRSGNNSRVRGLVSSASTSLVYALMDFLTKLTRSCRDSAAGVNVEWLAVVKCGHDSARLLDEKSAGAVIPRHPTVS